MKATSAEPRDLTHRTDDPAYWVILRRGSDADGFRLTECLSVHEVIAWAEANAAGRTIEVFVEVNEGDEPQLIRLVGGHRTAPGS